ncbi:hypothetical protein QFZ31_006700 [Neobacillus niacini]|nr:hypothetical protein [Neobacillus niacini]
MFGKLNMYFFGQERICLSDFLWFYGILFFVTVITLVAVIPAQIQLLNN